MSEPQLRHRCRNPRCKTKLAEPVEDERHAFCSKFCWDQFYQKHCVVCEADRKPNRLRSCRPCFRAACKSAFRRLPEKYANPWGREKHEGAPIHEATEELWPARSGTCWSWVEQSGHTWRLHDREHIEVARIRREGNGWRVAKPVMCPEPPVEPLEDAKRRGVCAGLAAMDVIARKRSKEGHNAIPLNLIGGYGFNSTIPLDSEQRRAILSTERNVQTDDAASVIVARAPSVVPAPDPEDAAEIPEFLRR